MDFSVGFTVFDTGALTHEHCEVISQLLSSCEVGVVIISPNGGHPYIKENALKKMIKNEFREEFDLNLFVAILPDLDETKGDGWFYKAYGACLAKTDRVPIKFYSARDKDARRVKKIQDVRVLTTLNTEKLSKEISEEAMKNNFTLASKSMTPTNLYLWRTING